ncbi:Rrf2 family transcriptional regulator [Halioxenophilus sp. WMMB6]|uniref:Rrf2 family transcriptional regulator n=1 Tax=Halioxenophilus sp. WMMB6 TaxID=3073815 RepID=UPI00295EFF20|nr:Rrf2 family transcriptional regulator [Halioxenophilus sp. WMMB6]
MQLTKHTDYAFRTLIYLASNRDQLSNIQTIADTFELSKSHLMKVVNKLVNLGWVESVRGKKGGVRLAQEPYQIGVADVIMKMEQTLSPINCESPLCTINSACTLKPVLWQAQQEYLRFLKKYTLADVLNDPTVQILKMA